VAASTCTPLRRTPLAFAMAGLIGPAGLIFALVFGAMSLRVPFWLVVVVPFAGLALLPAMRPLRLCDGSLVVPRFIMPEFRLPLAEVTAIEIGTFKWSGLSGYSGNAVALQTINGRRLVHHSLYCGERRISVWIETIRAEGGFSGPVHRIDHPERWEGPHGYPVV
jgi:hypothetical protein